MWGEAFVSLLESVFWVYFQTKYHGKRIKGLAGKAGAACALLLLALNIWIADYYTKYSSYTFLVDLFTLFWYSEWFLAGKRSRKVFSIFILVLVNQCVDIDLKRHQLIATDILHAMPVTIVPDCT